MQVGKEGYRGEIRLGCFRGKIKIRAGFWGQTKVSEVIRGKRRVGRFQGQMYWLGRKVTGGKSG